MYLKRTIHLVCKTMKFRFNVHVQALCTITGFITNGEWNNLRLKGRTRPLSIIQIRASVRAKYGRMGYKRMLGMLTPICKYYIVFFSCSIYM